MGFFPVLLLIVGTGALSWISWISIQSLLQARALFRLARVPRDAEDERGRLAVHGRVRLAQALSKGFGDLLWCRTQHQVYRRRRKNSRWDTVSTLEEIASFTLETSRGEVTLDDHPSEVQGTQSRTDTHERSGLFGWGHGNGDRRTVYTYLPAGRVATAVGRRNGPASVGKDNQLGLLLSPHEPGHAASIEVWKGIAGLAIVTAGIAVGLVLYYR